MKRYAVLVAVAVVVGPACSEGTPHAGPSTPGTALSATRAPTATASTTGAASTAPTGPAGTGPAAVPRKGSATPRATAAATGKPAATPSWATDVPVTATVSPACVRPGQKATLKVRTKANAAIAYGAKYADGEYGAAPPFGKGYGGSGHDTADDGGRYETSWTVSANAPGGAATVDVVVGWQGDGGSTHPSFTVAGLDGNC